MYTSLSPQNQAQELALARQHNRLLRDALGARTTATPATTENSVANVSLPLPEPDFSHLPSPHQRAKLWRVFDAWLKHFDPYALTHHAPTAQALRERVIREYGATVGVTEEKKHIDNVVEQVTQQSLRVRPKDAPQNKGDYPKPTHSSYQVDFGLILRKLVDMTWVHC